MTITRRAWTIPGQKTKRLAWGFSVTVDGKRIRSYRADWSKDDAKAAEATALLKIETTPGPHRDVGITLAQAIDRYLLTRTKRGNARSSEERRLATHLKTAFGGGTPLSRLTAARVSEYRDSRLGATSERTHRPLTAAAVNRPLALLRGLMTLARDEWELLAVTPRIKLAAEPQGRIRWLEADEEARLLTACAKSPTRHLRAVVIVAMETGLRRTELLDLTWDRVDLSRGVLRLEVTKSGKRREVPMRQVVYDVLAALPGDHKGRVWPTGSIRTAFETAVIEAKLDSPFRFHDLRHHFASSFVMRGGSIPELQVVLGHATLAMTMRYAHLSPKHLRDAMARTERLTERLPATPQRGTERTTA